MYDYDRRIAAKNKTPVSKRSPLEQAIYWAEGARSWLLSGAPDVARKDLEKAAAIIARDAGLKRIPGLASKVEACFKALSSYNPRGADHLVENVVALLKGSSNVEPLTPDDAVDHFAKAVASLRKHMREFEVVRKPGPVRNPHAYDMTWTLQLARDVAVAVMISYGAGIGVRLQVSEDRSGKITRILNETLTKNYALLIQSCLSHWYDRAHQTPW